VPAPPLYVACPPTDVVSLALSSRSKHPRSRHHGAAPRRTLGETTTRRVAVFVSFCFGKTHTLTHSLNHLTLPTSVVRQVVHLQCTMAATATSKSALSTESPPFNPNQILSRGRNSPYSSTRNGGVSGSSSRSRSSSPYPQQDHPNSNAAPKYVFRDPTTG
jgi:hypothetical protein